MPPQRPGTFFSVFLINQSLNLLITRTQALEPTGRIRCETIGNDSLALGVVLLDGDQEHRAGTCFRRLARHDGPPLLSRKTKEHALNRPSDNGALPQGQVDAPWLRIVLAVCAGLLF